MKNLVLIQISGILAGRMWMPAGYAWKEFNVKFVPSGHHFAREWHGMRDALDDITNDGDFSSVGIVEAMIKVTWRSDRNTTITRAQGLNLGAKALRDFKADPKAVEAYFFGGIEE